AVENKSLIQRQLIRLYRLAYKNASCVFFQNEENYKFFVDNNIKINNYEIISGSGVNTDEFSLLPYPPDELVRFVFISRIMKEKGIDQYIQAAKYIRKEYPFIKFYVIWFCKEENEIQINNLNKKRIKQ